METFARGILNAIGPRNVKPDLLERIADMFTSFHHIHNFNVKLVFNLLQVSLICLHMKIDWHCVPHANGLIISISSRNKNRKTLDDSNHLSVKVLID